MLFFLLAISCPYEKQQLWNHVQSLIRLSLSGPFYNKPWTAMTIILLDYRYCKNRLWGATTPYLEYVGLGIIDCFKAN